MIYRSNLVAPDLTPHFKLKNPPLQAMGHDMPSDPDFLPGCGFLTHDEAAILFHIAKAWTFEWVDIGARLGWTAAHLLHGGANNVRAIEPEYAHNEVFMERAMKQAPGMLPTPYTSEEFFKRAANNGFGGLRIDAAMIDGNHDAPEPTLDALRAINAGAEVLVWHDFQGKPVRDAVRFALSGGKCKCRVYDTPNGMAVAWLDGCGFVPPDHVPDQAIDWAVIRTRYSDFDFRRTV